MYVYIYIYIYIYIYREKERERVNPNLSDATHSGARGAPPGPGSSVAKSQVGMAWGSFLIAAAALKTATRNGDRAQGVKLNIL